MARERDNGNLDEREEKSLEMANEKVDNRVTTLSSSTQPNVTLDDIVVKVPPALAVQMYSPSLLMHHQAL